jgi:hypothetical protein
MTLPARFLVVQEAIDVVLRHLECLPTSDRAELLRAWVQECVLETEPWSVSPPTDREREGLMKRILALHVAVTNLERHAILAVTDSVATR